MQFTNRFYADKQVCCESLLCDQNTTKEKIAS